MYSFEVAALSDIGKLRKSNQDSYFVRIGKYEKNQIGMFCVADGMGGLSNGEFASNVVIDEIRIWWDKKLPKLLEGDFNEDNIFYELNYIFKSANFKIMEYAESINKKMGTTCSVLFIYNNKYFIAHIGDSRIYMIREEKMNQLTIDDTLVNKQINEGIITREEAKNHPKKNVLTQCLGVKENINILFKSDIWKRKDMFVLCSDGLYNMIDEKEILKISSQNITDMKGKVKNIIEYSKEKTANDNITIILLEVK